MASLTLASSAYAFDEIAEVQNLINQSKIIETPSEVLVPTSMPGIKVVVPIQPGKPNSFVPTSQPESTNAVDTKKSNSSVFSSSAVTKNSEKEANAASTQKDENSKSRFSIASGVKKGFSYVIAPFTAYPLVTALIACGGIVYAIKKGYLNQLLIKLGIKEEEDTRNLQVSEDPSTLTSIRR